MERIINFLESIMIDISPFLLTYKSLIEWHSNLF